MINLCVQIVKSHLWSVCPPEPRTAEEAVIEQQQEAAEAASKASCGLVPAACQQQAPGNRVQIESQHTCAADYLS